MSEAVRTGKAVRTGLAHPRPGQVRVRQRAIGLGAVGGDVLGAGAVGSVEAIGSGVVGFAVGDRVAYEAAPDAVAEVRMLSAERLIGVPRAVTDRQAAAFLGRGLKARVLVKQLYAVGRGEVVLVQGAASGIAAMVVAWAVALGARVIAVVDSPSKVAQVRRLGAAKVIVAGARDRAQAQAAIVSGVRDFTHGLGADVVYDGVGAATFGASAGSVRSGGTIVLYAAPSGLPEPDERALAERSVRLVRPAPAARAHAGTLQLAAAEVFLAIRDGVFSRLPITSYPVVDAAEAHKDLALGRATGSVLLLPPLTADLAA
jgi:NADPH2:quinone reductase